MVASPKSVATSRPAKIAKSPTASKAAPVVGSSAGGAAHRGHMRGLLNRAAPNPGKGRTVNV